MKPKWIYALVIFFLSSCIPVNTPTSTITHSPNSSYTSIPSTTGTYTPIPSSSSTPNPVPGTLLPTQLTTVPTLNPTQVIQHEEIKSVIQEYFEIHFQALSILPPEDFQETGFGDLVSDGPDAKDFLETEMAKLAVERKHLELKKYRYTEYEYSLDYLDIVVEEATQIAKVHLIEKFVIFCELSLVDDPENPRP